MSTDEQIRLVYRDWWETCGTIRGRDGQLIRAIQGELSANQMQSEIDEVIEWCELKGEPCRLIILKPRKEGATTFLVGKSYHLLRSTEAHLLQIGDQLQTTQTMWDMLRTYQDEDGFDSWAGAINRMTVSAQQGHAKWSHGSTAWTETAGDRRAGQSKTPTIIHAEEVAHWGRDGMANNASDTMLALLNAIADVPQTYVFVSSTANGVGNWYHRTYGGSVTLAERKTGKKGNGWIRVFLPWHKSRWAYKEVTQPEREEIASTLTDSEKRGQVLWRWLPEQIAWRRHQIINKSDGDEAKFNQENPPDETACFITSGRPVFHQDGLLRLEKLSQEAKFTHGILDKTPIGLVFRDESDGWLTVFEPPEIGGAYLSSLDTCRHEQAEGAKEPDEHSFWVLRASHKDAEGVLHNARTVARIRPPCRWNPDILAEHIALVLKWYGDPMIVPEANQGLDVIGELRKHGVVIYKRKKFDRVNPGKTIQTVGWETNEQTRPVLVSALEKAIREQSFDCDCPRAVSQMRTFVRDARGKAKASSGCHDDDVMALGIGLACIESVTVLQHPAYYHPPEMRPENPFGGGAS